MHPSINHGVARARVADVDRAVRHAAVPRLPAWSVGHARRVVGAALQSVGRRIAAEAPAPAPRARGAPSARA